MIRGQLADWMTDDVELYNVLEDPYELNNLASARTDLVEEMTETLEEWWRVYE